MPGQQPRRRFTLEPRHDDSTDDLSLEDVRRFLEVHTDRRPELVSVTVTVEDSVRDSGTTN